MKIVGLNTVFTDKVKSFIKGTPMAKVYCKDCSKFDTDSVVFGIVLANGEDSCIYGTKTIDQAAYGKNYLIRLKRNALKHNANNDCKDFKRKWWKIWL